MEIQQLKGFLAVAKYQNFTIAAKKTQRTQPTISLQIKALEDELGIKLFERIGSKQVTLTSEGKVLQRLAAPLVQEFSQLGARFFEARGIYDASSLSIATHSSVMIYLLPNVIKKFLKRYPQCQLKILNRNRNEILEMIDSGEADIGITSLDTVSPGISYKPFSRYDRILIAHNTHPIAKKKQITLKEVSEFPLIVPTLDSTTRKIIDKEFERANLAYNIAMEVVGRTAIKTYVGIGLGISIINEYYVTEEDKKTLFVKDMSKYFGKAETGIAFKRGITLSAPAQEFIDLVCEQQQ